MEDIVRRIVREEIEAAFDTSAVRVERQVIAINPQAHYSVAKAAELLDVSRAWVYTRIQSGEIRVVELGGGQAKQRISTVELQRYLDRRAYGGVKHVGDPLDAFREIRVP
ncbi:helix-turn-helix domain-containing protein [Lacisediminihabitans profunda]|nr:helix-turn-helix domain-containing protein [Lacisediminihabitans profunda]